MRINPHVPWASTLFLKCNCNNVLSETPWKHCQYNDFALVKCIVKIYVTKPRGILSSKKGCLLGTCPSLCKAHPWAKLAPGQHITPFCNEVHARSSISDTMINWMDSVAFYISSRCLQNARAWAHIRHACCAFTYCESCTHRLKWNKHGGRSVQLIPFLCNAMQQKCQL